MENTSETRKLEDVLPNFPEGPLTPYRKLASFDWRKMKLALEDEEIIFYKYDIWNFIENHPLFQHSPQTLPFDELRHLSMKRAKVLKQHNILPFPKVLSNSKITGAWMESLYMYDVNCSVKLSLPSTMFTNTVRSLGTERHYDIIEAADNGEILGCFALTEVAHGSNAKGMRTTASYDIKTKQFVLHSADFAAAKCWAGGLGQCATHAALYAKLITPDGKDHGLHTFVVPIRCKQTLRPFPGVIVGDMGEKIALNGVDNGFVMFNNYFISKDCLLNKMADVDDNGNYVSPIKDPSKRFGASLGALSGGRVQITGIANNNITKAITIAVRYSALRKQFGPENSNEEYAVLEYQQQQFRLIPYIAVAYATGIFFRWFSETHSKFLMETAMGVKKENDPEMGMEIHALSSSSKPISAWAARDGIQVCREACGGHGYLQASGIGNIRNENDANCTYEGENSILIQQTSNWLLRLLKSVQKGDRINYPLDTANYLNDYNRILKTKGNINSSSQAMNPEGLLNAYKWLVCYLLKLTSEKAESLAKQGNDSFAVRNNIQSYHAVSLSIVYCEHAILNHFYKFALGVQDQNCRAVLMKLVSLYGVWNIEKHLATFYMGEYFHGNAGHFIRDAVIGLCKELKSEAVTLVDAISPPDFILNSVLGMSDGKLYENLQASFFSYPGSLSRPEWWKDVLNWNTSTVSKL